MSGRIGRVWDAVAGTAAESRVPWAGLGWEFVAASPQRLVPRPRRSPGPLLVDTATPAACDHGAARWQPQSTHRTSAGTVAYARCRCGAWLVLLDGQPLAAARPRPRAATPPAPGERPRGLWKKWTTWRRRRRADPR
jgi:hypothetical protein